MGQIHPRTKFTRVKYQSVLYIHQYDAKWYNFCLTILLADDNQGGGYRCNDFQSGSTDVLTFLHARQML